MIELYALAASLILLGLSVFQFMLIAGVPIGNFAWGGAHRVLPRRLRIGSAVSIGLYAVFAAFILSRASVVDVIKNDAVLTYGMWIFTGYFFLGVFMNAISRSKKERLLMTPVALTLAILFLFVARG